MYKEMMMNTDNLESSLQTSILLKICSVTSCTCQAVDVEFLQGQIQGGPGPPLTTKNEAPAPKFYKTEAPEWQF